MVARSTNNSSSNNNNNGRSSSPATLHVTPSELQVDFDKDVTELYQAITDQNWERAIAVSKAHPVQAATWVVRHYNDNDDDDDDDDDEPEIMWRFLPLHSATARQPPSSVMEALLQAYPDAAACVDDQGMYALHYACGNQASAAVIRQLIAAFPAAAKISDPRGMLPIHYLACWGPSELTVVDTLLTVTSLTGGNMPDQDGNTPLDLAMDGEYPDRDAVVKMLQKWLVNANSNKQKMIHRRNNSHGSSYNDPLVVTGDPTTKATTSTPKKPLEPQSTLDTTTAQTPRITNNNNNSRREQRESMKDIQNSSSTRQGASQEQRDQAPVIGSGGGDWNSVAYLQHKVKRQQVEMAELQAELDAKNKALAECQSQHAHTKEKLASSKSECSGLRVTLGDMMEKHEQVQKKSSETVTRLASLQISLDNIMAMQDVLTHTVTERNANHAQAGSRRQDLFQQLTALDRSVASDENKLDAALQKQTREMEAIAAVIKAAAQEY